MQIPEKIVFDAEPLVAHADDESGGKTVERWLDAVSVDDSKGYVNHVNLAETRYILARKYSQDVANEYIEWLLDIGVRVVDSESVWVEASNYILDYNPALGDSFALATAEERGATLLVGADDDYDGISRVSIERFREEPA
ncbi:MAG: PIN domain-containing protein [Halobacteria archaeon]|nr:PIN domain-containing protein [Halobacteria archaeon]